MNPNQDSAGSAENTLYLTTYAQLLERIRTNGTAKINEIYKHGEHLKDTNETRESQLRIQLGDETKFFFRHNEQAELHKRKGVVRAGVLADLNKPYVPLGSPRAAHELPGFPVSVSPPGKTNQTRSARTAKNRRGYKDSVSFDTDGRLRSKSVTGDFDRANSSALENGDNSIDDSNGDSIAWIDDLFNNRMRSKAVNDSAQQRLNRRRASIDFSDDESAFVDEQQQPRKSLQTRASLSQQHFRDSKHLNSRRSPSPSLLLTRSASPIRSPSRSAMQLDPIGRTFLTETTIDVGRRSISAQSTSPTRTASRTSQRPSSRELITKLKSGIPDNVRFPVEEILASSARIELAKKGRLYAPDADTDIDIVAAFPMITVKQPGGRKRFHSAMQLLLRYQRSNIIPERALEFDKDLFSLQMLRHELINAQQELFSGNESHTASRDSLPVLTPTSPHHATSEIVRESMDSSQMPMLHKGPSSMFLIAMRPNLAKAQRITTPTGANHGDFNDRTKNSKLEKAPSLTNVAKDAVRTRRQSSPSPTSQQPTRASTPTHTSQDILTQFVALFLGVAAKASGKSHYNMSDILFDSTADLLSASSTGDITRASFALPRRESTSVFDKSQISAMMDRSLASLDVSAMKNDSSVLSNGAVADSTNERADTSGVVDDRNVSDMDQFESFLDSAYEGGSIKNTKFWRQRFVSTQHVLQQRLQQQLEERRINREFVYRSKPHISRVATNAYLQARNWDRFRHLKKTDNIWKEAREEMEREKDLLRHATLFYRRLLIFLDFIGSPTNETQRAVIHHIRKQLVDLHPLDEHFLWDLVSFIGNVGLQSKETLRIVHFIRSELDISMNSFFQYLKRHGYKLTKELISAKKKHVEEMRLNEERAKREKKQSKFNEFVNVILSGSNTSASTADISSVGIDRQQQRQQQYIDADSDNNGSVESSADDSLVTDILRSSEHAVDEEVRRVNAGKATRANRTVAAKPLTGSRTNHQNRS